MRFLYTCLYLLLIPVILLRLLWRSIKSPRYRRRWRERFGMVRAEPQSQGGIWVHAVSVGETIAAVPMIKAIQTRWPNLPVWVTTMTPTGSAQVTKNFGDSVHHVYAPYDLPWFINGFLKAVKPKLAVVMETELWPNTISGCYQQQIPVLLANARLSEKSWQGYDRIGRLSRPMLQKLTLIAAQTEADAERFTRLGVEDSQLIVTGNIKFDLDISEQLKAQAASLKAQLRGEESREVFIAASTHQGEDEQILDAFAKLKTAISNLLLILVPRHPERFDQVAGLCEKSGLGIARRSEGTLPTSTDAVYLGDTIGDLLLLFGAADVAFVGGSLVPVGGHNMIEPAAWGLPVVAGSSRFNFQEVSDVLLDAGAMEVCSDGADIADVVTRILTDETVRHRMGESARRVAQENRGALAKLMGALESQCQWSSEDAKGVGET